MQNQILIATNNSGKLGEFQRMLASFPFQLRSLSDFPSIVEVEESGHSFRENAILKARGYALQTGLMTLADDSGLEVSALGGAPGVFSARYAGIGAPDMVRVDKLLNELSEVPEVDRKARFVCVIAVFEVLSSRIYTFEGTCDGRIAFEPRGDRGFGYDPIFIPNSYEESFGELPESVKQNISHRARALSAANEFLRDAYRSRA